MAESTKVKGLLAKIESTYGTDPTPAAGSDEIQVEENLWSNIEVGYLEDNLRENAAVQGMGRAGATVPGARFCHFTVPVALKGTGAAYAASTVPQEDVLLRIAGLEQSVDTTGGSELVTYTPRSSGFESATCYVYSSGSEYQVTGCLAQLTEITFIPVQILVATFEVWGMLDTDPTDASLPSFTYLYTGLQPPVTKAAGLTLNSFDPDDFRSMTFDMRTALPARPGGNASTGHAGYQIVDWDPMVTVTMETPAKANLNPYELHQNGTLFAWDIGPVGPAQYNQIKLSGPAGRVTEVPHGDQDNLAMIDFTFRCQNTDINTEGDAFSLQYS